MKPFLHSALLDPLPPLSRLCQMANLQVSETSSSWSETTSSYLTPQVCRCLKCSLQLYVIPGGCLYLNIKLTISQHLTSVLTLTRIVETMLVQIVPIGLLSEFRTCFWRSLYWIFDLRQTACRWLVWTHIMVCLYANCSTS